MARVIEEWSLPNDGFKFRHNPPDGCGDMGVGVGGLGGGGYREVVAVYLVRLYWVSFFIVLNLFRTI